jgi:hypothetical protein
MRKGNYDILLKNMDTDKAVRILAKSLYRELTRNGFTNKDVVNFAKEIFDHMAQEMHKESISKESTKKGRLLIG